MRNSDCVVGNGKLNATDRGWRDEVTELHVLARNGDAEAAAVAARWCAEEPRVRQLWDEVEHACGQVDGFG
jgi:hypothetical protein